MSINILETALRPGEIVQHYIEREFLSGQNAIDLRLPTIERLAAHLQVSPSTVRNVVRRLSKEGRLSTTQGKGTYIKTSNSKAGPTPLLLATNMTFFDAAHPPNWSETIYLGAARMASTMPRSISMMSVASRTQKSNESVQEDLLRQIDHIDLLMLFAQEERHQLRRAFQEAGKAVVDINPPSSNATSNFVSTDFFEIGMRVGRVWHASGRRRFLYIANNVKTNVSGQLLLAGFSLGCQRDEDSSVSLRVRFANDMSWESGHSTMQEVLKEEELPDAILCSGDVIALGVLDALNSRKLSVPEQVSLIGGTGLVSTRLEHPELTTILQPMEQIGATAVRMLCDRLDNQCRSVPGIYLPATLHAGRTTVPNENSLFPVYTSSPETSSP